MQIVPVVEEQIGSYESSEPPPLEIYDEDPSFQDTPSVVPASELEKHWPAFVDAVSHDRPNLGAFLAFGQLVSCSESAVDIKFPANSAFPFMEVTKKGNRDEITRMLHRFCQASVELRITIEERASEERVDQNYIKQKSNATNINDEIEKEPIIQALMDIFDGEILG